MMGFAALYPSYVYLTNLFYEECIAVNVEELKTQLQQELPGLLQQDPGFKQWLNRLIRDIALPKESFDEKFDRVMTELAADREAQMRKWQAQEQKWHEQMQQNRGILAEIRHQDKRHEQSIGALGARWGMASEESFRSALKGILEQSFAVEVMNVNDYDAEGVVFGGPDQVEIDIIVKNGLVIACELKSSMSKSDIYTFERKVKFYEKRHQRPVNRRIVISPMVHPTAKPVAEKLGIEVFTYADETTGL